ncbi:MAG: competence/damage-inducible protein A, partial [Zetaproteobacteria bacterium]
MGWTQASLLVIGDEILSGRTREANAYFAAALLHARGCEVREVTIVPDEEEAIVAALHRLRASPQAVITSGGIGPTHDDRTIEAVARALGRKVVMHEPTLRELERRTGRRDPVR